jgi:hypothetical protein
MAALAPLVLAVPLALTVRRQRALLRTLERRCAEAEEMVAAARVPEMAGPSIDDAPDVFAHLEALRSGWEAVTGQKEVAADATAPAEARLTALRHEILDTEWQLMSGVLDPMDGLERLRGSVTALYPTAEAATTAWRELRSELREQLGVVLHGVATRGARETLVALEAQAAEVDALLGVDLPPFEPPEVDPERYGTASARDALDTLAAVVRRHAPEAPPPAAEDDDPEATGRHGGDPRAEIEAALAELDTALVAIEERLANGGGEPAAVEPDAGAAARREEELRELVLQFTRDSRDMLNCIAELETTNARLTEELEAARAGAPAPAPPASDAAEETEDVDAA